MPKPNILISEPHICFPRDFETSGSKKIIEVKPLGETLIEADLVSPAQVQLALRDQRNRQELILGEILALRGWIKQETANFFARRWFEQLSEDSHHPIGYYFQEAALLNEKQIQEILDEQKRNWFKFGAIAVLKGWMKQNTVNYFIKYLAPEQTESSIYVDKTHSKATKPTDGGTKSQTKTRKTVTRIIHQPKNEGNNIPFNWTEDDSIEDILSKFE